MAFTRAFTITENAICLVLRLGSSGREKMDRELLQDVEKALTDLVKALARRRARMDAEDEAKRRAVPQSPPPPNLAPEAPSLQLGLESLLRMREVKEITKYSAATIYRKI